MPMRSHSFSAVAYERSPRFVTHIVANRGQPHRGDNQTRRRRIRAELAFDPHPVDDMQAAVRRRLEALGLSWPAVARGARNSVDRGKILLRTRERHAERRSRQRACVGCVQALSAGAINETPTRAVMKVRRTWLAEGPSWGSA